MPFRRRFYATSLPLGHHMGAVLGLRVGRITARARCPDLMAKTRPLSARAPDCGRAVWSGAGKGAMGSGLAGFLMAPILLLGPAAASAWGHRFDFNRAIAVSTGVGAVAGGAVDFIRCRSP